jgi:hypothetical protein
LFDEKDELVATIPGDFRGELIEYRGIRYRAAGWIVPAEDKSGDLRYFAYRQPKAAAAPIVVIEDDGRARMAPKRVE